MEQNITSFVFLLCVFQPTLLNRVQPGNQLAEKMLVSHLPSTSKSGQDSASSSSVSATRQATPSAKAPTADITSMSLASLFENTESSQFGLGFGSGGLLGLRGACLLYTSPSPRD